MKTALLLSTLALLLVQGPLKAQAFRRPSDPPPFYKDYELNENERALPEERVERGSYGEFVGRALPEERVERGSYGEFVGRVLPEERVERGSYGEFVGRVLPEERVERGSY